MADYIPGPDDAFQSWLGNFGENATEMSAFIHITNAELTALTALRDAFTSDLQSFVGQQSAFHSATSQKNASRAAAENDVANSCAVFRAMMM